VNTRGALDHNRSLAVLSAIIILKAADGGTVLLLLLLLLLLLVSCRSFLKGTWACHLP
jgi:hypothetical protein